MFRIGNLIVLSFFLLSCGSKNTDTSPYRSSNLFPVEKYGKHGYIDNTGKLIIPLQFEDARDFYDGLAGVSIGGKYGFIDETGKYVLNPQFDNANGFIGGVIAVNLGGKWGFIERSGKYIINSLLKNPDFGSAVALRY